MRGHFNRAALSGRRNAVFIIFEMGRCLEAFNAIHIITKLRVSIIDMLFARHHENILVKA